MTTKRFQFDDLDIEPDAMVVEAREKEEEDKPPPPPEPMIPQSEHEQLLSAARQSARQEGEAAGLAQARAEAHQANELRLAQAVEMAGQRLSLLLQQMDEASASIEAEALHTAMTAAKTLLPDLARKNGLHEIESVVAEALSERMDEPRIVLRCADAQYDALQARLDQLTEKTGFSGRLILLADPAMAEGDCLVEWADGGVERRPQDTLSAIESATEDAVAVADSATSQADPSVPAIDQPSEADLSNHPVSQPDSAPDAAEPQTF